MNLLDLAKSAQKSAIIMRTFSTEQKNNALRLIEKKLRSNKAQILTANALDMEAGEKAGLGNLLDRMLLTEERIDSICDDVLNVAELKDSVGEIIDDKTVKNGLELRRVRTPLGVVGMIYEARPNVTVDATVLCLKSGNAVMLKGGSAVINSNRVIVRLMQEALDESDLPAAAVQFIDSIDRSVTSEFLHLKQYIDVIIPRGGKSLIDFVVNESSVPVIETGASIVHIYVDESADINKAVPLVVNSKTRRVSICNSMDVLLLHRSIYEQFLPAFAEALMKVEASGKPLVEIRADESCSRALRGVDYQNLQNLNPDEDFDTEFLDYTMAVKVVDSLDEGIEHIQNHSLKHTDAILTENKANALRFLNEIDSACCYWNASTQFSDGAQFGLGAEIGISTQKLHVRGPFALEGLTSFKWTAKGDYAIRD